MALEPNKQILIVDDNIDLADSIAEFLQMHGMICDVAYDAEQAKQRLSKRVSDLLLLDLDLPKKSGILLIQELQKELPDLPIIVATARVIEDVPPSPNVKFILPKPINADALINTLRVIFPEMQPKAVNLDTIQYPIVHRSVLKDVRLLRLFIRYILKHAVSSF